MTTVTFTYLEAECEYNFETKNLHVISEQSFNSPVLVSNLTISKKHAIWKEDIKSITFKHPNTKLPSELYNYFSDYPNLEYIELEKLDFKNVETINGFIYDCPKLKEITIAHKNAKNLISIRNFIVETQSLTSITIKHINAPNLQEINCMLWNIRQNIKEITIEDITSPNINTVNYLINNSSIESLNLTKIGSVNTYSINTLIASCINLKTLEMKPLTNTKEIKGFIQKTPALKSKIISKINKIEKLYPYFLELTPKNETLDLNKFEDITNLASHLNLASKHLQQYPSIKIGGHRLKFSEYSIILENSIPIQDKTEEEIVKEIIEQSKYESKTTIEKLLTTLKTKDIFKNEKYKNELTSKLTIIKNLK